MFVIHLKHRNDRNVGLILFFDADTAPSSTKRRIPFSSLSSIHVSMFPSFSLLRSGGFE